MYVPIGIDCDFLDTFHSIAHATLVWCWLERCSEKNNSVLQSTTPVILCTVLLQYYSVPYYSNTALYYKVLLQYYCVLQNTIPVLLCTTKYYSSTVRSDHDPRMKPSLRNPPLNRGYFSRPPRAFCIEKCNISRSGYHSKFHEILHLPRKVTLELHQMLRLPRKVTFELHQILRLPRKVALQLHQLLRLPPKVTLQLHEILRLPREVTLQLHQILRLPPKVTWLFYYVMTLLLLDSSITWLCYYLTLLLLKSSITWPY